MLSSKYISKITITLISVVLVLCVLAMTFYDKLIPVVNTTGYSMEYQDKLFDTDNVLDIDIVMDSDKRNRSTPINSTKKRIIKPCMIFIEAKTPYTFLFYFVV